MKEIAAIALISAFVVFIVWANISLYRERAAMTSEERDAYDEELTDDLRVW